MTTPTCRREREARFWVYVNGGPVKLTLYPGQRLRWGRASSHDEGWSAVDEPGSTRTAL